MLFLAPPSVVAPCSMKSPTSAGVSKTAKKSSSTTQNRQTIKVKVPENVGKKNVFVSLKIKPPVLSASPAVGMCAGKTKPRNGRSKSAGNGVESENIQVCSRVKIRLVFLSIIKIY